MSPHCAKTRPRPPDTILRRILARHPVRISVRTSGGTDGRPLRRRLFQVQKTRKPSRCQAMTVSSFAITGAVGSLEHVQLMAERDDIEM